MSENILNDAIFNTFNFAKLLPNYFVNIGDHAEHLRFASRCKLWLIIDFIYS